MSTVATSLIWVICAVASCMVPAWDWKVRVSPLTTTIRPKTVEPSARVRIWTWALSGVVSLSRMLAGVCAEALKDDAAMQRLAESTRKRDANDLDMDGRVGVG